MRAFVTSAAIVLLGASLVASGESAPAAPTRVIDRTFSCTTIVQAGVRQLYVSGSEAVPELDDLRSLSHASVVSGSYPHGPRLISVSAGRTTPAGYDRFLPFYVDGAYCTPSTARVWLSTRGLAGGATGQLGERLKCYPTRKILLRARVRFLTPTSLRRNQGSALLTTRAKVAEGQFALASLGGKPLAYASVSESGKTRLFAVGGCVDD